MAIVPMLTLKLGQGVGRQAGEVLDTGIDGRPMAGVPHPIPGSNLAKRVAMMDRFQS